MSIQEEFDLLCSSLRQPHNPQTQTINKELDQKSDKNPVHVPDDCNPQTQTVNNELNQKQKSGHDSLYPPIPKVPDNLLNNVFSKFEAALTAKKYVILWSLKLISQTLISQTQTFIQ